MKSFITAVLLLLSLTVSAQFDVTTGKDINKTITIESKQHKILETNGGSPYIICNSPQTKNDYPVWIGSETDKTYQDKPVRKSKSGKYFILIVSTKSNNPYAKYIKEEI